MSYEAIVYRVCDYETPLWAYPNTKAGRWNRADEHPAQYLSLHPMTPWAEVIRGTDQRAPEQCRALRLPIWALRIGLEEAPTPIGFAEASNYGLAPEDLVSDDLSACQALAAGLRDMGVGAITCPSAALPGTENLIVLAAALVIDYQLEPVDDEDIPTAMIAQGGHCPEGLWDLVHYRGAGTMHPGLAAYLAEDTFEFVQPEVTSDTLLAGRL